MSTNDPAGVESTGTTTADAASSYKPTIDWEGPFVETDAYGEPTGYTYVRCPECGIEVLTSGHTHATHRSGCSYQ